jgi:hypothetical protein
MRARFALTASRAASENACLSAATGVELRLVHQDHARRIDVARQRQVLLHLVELAPSDDRERILLPSTVPCCSAGEHSLNAIGVGRMPNCDTPR